MFNSIAKTWDLIREVFKDVQKSDDKIPGYPPINSHSCREERMTREDDDIEPLGEVERLDGHVEALLRVGREEQDVLRVAV